MTKNKTTVWEIWYHGLLILIIKIGSWHVDVKLLSIMSKVLSLRKADFTIWCMWTKTIHILLFFYYYYYHGLIVSPNTENNHITTKTDLTKSGRTGQQKKGEKKGNRKENLQRHIIAKLKTLEKNRMKLLKLKEDTHKGPFTHTHRFEATKPVEVNQLHFSAVIVGMWQNGIVKNMCCCCFSNSNC